MGVKLVLQQEARSAVDEPVHIPFEFKNVPDGKEVGDSIVIRPATVRTWFKLKPLLVLIEKEDLGKIVSVGENSFSDATRDIMCKYDELIFEIVCIGIHNEVGDIPEWLKNVLKDSCTWEDILILFNAIVYRLGTTSFLNTITAALAVSPLGEEEIIALQENKESWTSKAVLPS
ncbi:hypothetical protein [Bacteroides sp. 51]|uniref:hypothetical protein n=1 Tax=Bacteroides sp. 51 TaxID=2302938 RepID=UPI0013D8D632|nr:hypothetical protein [Bacteroides sp. 51]NDV81331.1 hypothetical protein [Bacteroides sp. 51]